jgi:protocatechuate 3,4-dioxygenase, beta subunit
MTRRTKRNKRFTPFRMNFAKPLMNKKTRAFHIPIDRRRFFKSMALASAGFTLSGYLAEALTQSPIVTQGPYYPLADDIPLDKDNDLVQLGDNLTQAAGVVTYITGRVLDANGNPVKNALVELWHADREGDYVYSAGVGRNAACDANFAGFGQFLTGSSGAFKFRTVKAGLYQGRTRHYHWGVTLPGRTTRSTSQTFWNETAYDLNGAAWATQNANDNVYSTITNAAQRASILLSYAAVPGTTTSEVQANWDFVSGFTPAEPTYPGGGSLTLAGALVAGPVASNPRYKLTVPAYSGYTYEIYGNPTFADLDWRALPFSISQTGAIDRHKHTATSDGSLSFYVEAKAIKGFYRVSFRVPGANTGTP